MGILFSADEALKVAERIEGNAGAFYRKAAGLHSGERSQDLLFKLAAMEDQHQETFSLMRTQLSAVEKEPTTYDPMDESLLYLKALADQHGGEGSPTAADALTGKETMEQVLRVAIDLEHKTVQFYTGLREMVPASLGKDKLDRIIAEEKKHVVQLSKELSVIHPKS
ncbi:MAG: ferritin family protein [Verrucomicrobia bacterium]|nr:ferritin family protein [Verrucomicrobiota bacterium]